MTPIQKKALEASMIVLPLWEYENPEEEAPRLAIEIAIAGGNDLKDAWIASRAAFERAADRRGYTEEDVVALIATAFGEQAIRSFFCDLDSADATALLSIKSALRWRPKRASWKETEYIFVQKNAQIKALVNFE